MDQIKQTTPTDINERPFGRKRSTKEKVGTAVAAVALGAGLLHFGGKALDYHLDRNENPPVATDNSIPVAPPMAERPSRSQGMEPINPEQTTDQVMSDPETIRNTGEGPAESPLPPENNSSS